LPFDFWAFACGLVPLEALDPDTRRLFESAEAEEALPDPIEGRLAELEAQVRAKEEAEGLVGGRLPIGLKELANGNGEGFPG
jgi:hypothetical protein